MHIVTIGRRAGLATEIARRYAQLGKQLDAARSYYDAVSSKAVFGKPESRFHHSVCLIGLLAAFEAYLADSLTEFFVCFPGRLPIKQFDLSSLCVMGSTVNLIEATAERAAADLTYKTFPEMFGEALAVFSKKAKVDPARVACVNEIKCTRDLFVHANGEVNSLYLRKAGALARERRIGQPVPIDAAYLELAFAEVRALAADFFNGGPSQFGSHGKAKAFQEMWEATALSSLVAFSDAWWVENGEMVRPRDNFSWGWSISEKLLFDFFLRVYNTRHPDIDATRDVTDVLGRWPPPSPAGRVILSWLESPFGF
jgi:hypothetical protein